MHMGCWPCQSRAGHVVIDMFFLFFNPFKLKFYNNQPKTIFLRTSPFGRANLHDATNS
jgi:hypothetical protein